MGRIIFLLMVVGAGAAAYARARREDTWSWSLFGKTILALLTLGIGVGIMVVRLARWMGPENALLSTIVAMAMIAVGVAGITIWLRGKTRRNRKQ